MATATRHISVAIDRPANTVYEYASDPANMGDWANGLADSPLSDVDGVWVANSPMGQVTVEFAPRNEFGILDHVVTLPSGEAVVNPVRVIADGDDASEVVFTLRQRDMSNEQFEDDTQAVVRDLTRLKQVLESR